VDGVTSIIPTISASSIEIQILTSANIALCRTDPIVTSVKAILQILSATSTPSSYTIHSVPIMLQHSPPRILSSPVVESEDTARPFLRTAQNTICTWVCIDDVLGSVLSWSQYGNCGSIEWNIVNIFSRGEKSKLFTALHGNAEFIIQHLDDGVNFLKIEVI